MSQHCGDDVGECVHCGSVSDSVCKGAVQSFMDDGAAEERAKIVAWGRRQMVSGDPALVVSALLGRIEALEHLK